MRPSQLLGIGGIVAPEEGVNVNFRKNPAKSELCCVQIYPLIVICTPVVVARQVRTYAPRAVFNLE